MTVDALTIAYVAGGFSLAGILIGQLLASFNSWLEHRRERRNEQQQHFDNERAVMHGAFAVTNFIAATLSDYDSSRNVFDLTRLSVVQSYIAKLIDRSPPNSDRLMVSLVDLGLRLEALQFLVGMLIGAGDEFTVAQVQQVDNSVHELSAASELVQILVTGELPMMTDDELVEFPAYDASSDVVNGARKSTN